MKQAKKDLPKESDLDRRWHLAETRYLGGMPRSLPQGRVLVHNHVRPQAVLGRNGFRAWTMLLDEVLLEECRCDWAGVDLHGLKHYRVKLRPAAR